LRAHGDGCKKVRRIEFYVTSVTRDSQVADPLVTDIGLIADIDWIIFPALGKQVNSLSLYLRHVYYPHHVVFAFIIFEKVFGFFKKKGIRNLFPGD
jgi:hypothetical protein